MGVEEQKRQEKEWAEKIASKYGIFPSTVIHIKNNLIGKAYRNEKYVTKTQRTEEFFELYFAGIKEGR